jgi:CheY-like chemotaxis protein/HPt (histidine-containing phosphotransfer) domain-containing protein
VPKTNVTDMPVHGATDDSAIRRDAAVTDMPGADTRASSTAATKVVLVAQDNAAASQMVARGLLEGAGYHVDFAANGLEAVAAVTSTPGRFAAILMGCDLPRLDGYEAARVIRQLEDPGMRVPIIALAASALLAEPERCLAAGMDDVLVKPLDFALLEATLARWIDGVVPVEDPDHAVDATGLLDLDRIHMLQEIQNGESSFFAACVDSFLTRLPMDLETIEMAVDARDHQHLVAAAHSLKGSAQNLGAAEVGRTCQALEEATEPLDNSHLAELTAALRLHVERTVVALKVALHTPTA